MITIQIKQSDKCNGDYSLYLSFPYNANYIDYIRDLPSRAWNKNTKEWEVPSKYLKNLIEYFDKEDIHIVGNVNKLYKQPVEYKKPDNFEFKTEPFEHQIEGFKFGLTHDRWLLADEQGLGKTKQVIDIAIAKKQELG